MLVKPDTKNRHPRVQNHKAAVRTHASAALNIFTIFRENYQVAECLWFLECISRVQWKKKNFFDLEIQINFVFQSQDQFCGRFFTCISIKSKA